MSKLLQDFRIRYSDFSSMERFQNLITQFLSYDIDNGTNESSIKNEMEKYFNGKCHTPYVKCIFKDEVIDAQDTINMNFDQDFLKIKCANMHSNYITFLASKTLESSHLGLLDVYNKIDPYQKKIKQSIKVLKKI